MLVRSQWLSLTGNTSLGGLKEDLSEIRISFIYKAEYLSLVFNHCYYHAKEE